VQALKQQIDQLRASTAAVAAGTNAAAAAGGATQSATDEHPSSREMERLRHEVAMANQTAHVLRAEKAELKESNVDLAEKNSQLTEEIADLRRANVGLLRQLRGAESAHGGESPPDVSANDRRLDEQSRVIEEQKKLIAQLMELVNT
jgi:FtsZ-binding cell division protein ZapB